MSQNYEIIFKCSLCDNQFMQQEELRIHLFANHLHRSDENCEGSNQEFPSVNSNKIAENKCEICGKYFKQVSKLNRHIIEFHEDPENTFKKCSLCTKTRKFRNAKNLMKHMKIEHDGDKKGDNKNNTNISKADTFFKCEMCGKSFQKKKHTYLIIF